MFSPFFPCTVCWFLTGLCLQVVWRPYSEDEHAAEEPVACGSHLFFRECWLFSLFRCYYNQVGCVLRQFGLRQVVLVSGPADCSLGSIRGGSTDTPQQFAEQLENWRSGGTAPLSSGSAETEAVWRTWFDSKFGHLIVFHRAVFYGRSNVSMDVGPSVSIGDLCHELAIAHSRIEELVNNSFWCCLILLSLYLFTCLRISLVCADGRFRGDD